MAFIALVPRDAYAPGTYTFGPLRLPAKVKRCHFRISRFEKNPDGTRKAGTKLPDGKNVCRIVIQHKPTGAPSWQPWTEIPLPGGVLMSRESGRAVYQGATAEPYERHEDYYDSDVGPGAVRARLTVRVPLKIGIRVEAV